MNRIAMNLCLSIALLAASTFAQAEPANPAPSKPFSAYGSFELKEVTLDAADAATKGRNESTDKLRDNMRNLVTPIVEEWNKKPPAEGAPRLVIEPRVDTIKKVGGATRFFAGALAGDSHVTMHVRFTEQPGDILIAEPEFYQRASAMSGAWTVGGQDNDMLRRISKLVADYLRSNYDQATGGPTGRTE